MKKEKKEKVKLTKEEKKALKLEKKANRTMPDKEVVFKCVTSIICVATLCIASTLSVGKYTDAKIAAAKKMPVISNQASASTTPSTNSPLGEPVIIDDGTGTDTTTPDSDSTQTPADTTGKPAASSNDPTSYDKAQVVNYYNKCLKDAYAKRLQVKKSETIKIHLEETNAGEAVTKLFNNSILPKYAGTKEYDREYVNGVRGEQKITEYASPTGLTPDGAKTAAITKSGNNYVISIMLVPETSKLGTPPKYNQQAAHPLELEKVDLFAIKVTTADFNYSGTSLKAVVDANGKLISTEILQPLSGKGAGKLGIITFSATVSGSFEQKCTYKYL